ncbi:MAG: DUF2017 family protein [Acidimicrobiales bacterium]
MIGGRRRFTRDRQGRFRAGLGAGERRLLKSLPAQVQGLLEEHHPFTQRVFPVAYPTDEKAQEEYREIMGGHLLIRHQHALDVLTSTVDSPSIDEEEIREWLDALEVLRLVLGTQLDVSEDPAMVDESDPRAPQLAVYGYLSILQGEIIESLSELLPDDAAGGQGVEE